MIKLFEVFSLRMIEILREDQSSISDRFELLLPRVCSFQRASIEISAVTFVSPIFSTISSPGIDMALSYARPIEGPTDQHGSPDQENTVIAAHSTLVLLVRVQE